VLDKAAWPLMVERYVALAYDKGVMRSAKDLPQPLWPQLQVNDGEKSQTCNAFGLSSERPMIGFCPGAEFGPAKRWPHYHCRAGETADRRRLPDCPVRFGKRPRGGQRNSRDAQ
jgi:ADP-heptose:LPS heptosyltransferase